MSGGGGSLKLLPQAFRMVEKELKKCYISDMLHHHKNKKAFTLAEVLITLGIIGIVAAMTLPALISLYQKKIVETRLEHTYSLVSQALKLAEADYGDSQYWMRDSAGPVADNDGLHNVMDTFFQTYLTPYLKGSDYSTIDGYGLFKYGYNIRGFSKAQVNKIIRLDNGVFLFGNVGIGRQGVICVTILVDVNGPKPPNVEGRDLFQMIFSLYDGILFMSGERQVTGYGISYDKIIKYDEIMQRCKNTGVLECGALIKQNGWKIPKDYPYRI